MEKPRLAPARQESDGDLPKSFPAAGAFSNITLTGNARRKNVSTACDGCKRSRSKCSGEQPCQQCERSNTTCTYQNAQDGRLKESRKRKVQDLESDSDILTGLIRTIRTGDDAQVARIVALIRSNASIPETKLHIQRQLIEARQPQRASSSGVHHSHGETLNGERERASSPPSSPFHPRKPMDISRLTDSPPYRVPALPWTNVTNDDTLVSNLVSVWLTWEKSFYNWFDQDAFLDDMRKGQLGAIYCSPFMVNALLAIGCAHSDYEETQTKQGRPPQLMLDFIANAQKLLEEETDDISVTKVQGLGLLFLALSSNGQGNEGWMYLKRAAIMSSELDERYEHLDHTSATNEEERKLAKTLDTLCWGIFNVSTMVSYVLHRVPNAPIPRRKLPPSLRDNFKWQPYPRNNLLMPNHTNELFSYHSSLSLLVRDTCQLLYSDGETKRLEDETYAASIEQLYNRLLDWEKSRPAQLKPKEQFPSSIFTHQCYYLSLVMSILAPLKNQTNYVSREMALRSRDISFHAALKVAELCNYHRSLYGNRHVSMFVQQAVLLALNTLIDEPDNTRYQIEISNLCTYLRAMSRRRPISLIVMRMLQVAMRERGKKLPIETDRLFEKFERQDWHSHVLHTLNSIYPVVGDREEGKAETRRLNDYCESMAQLELNGSLHGRSTTDTDDDDRGEVSSSLSPYNTS